MRIQKLVSSAIVIGALMGSTALVGNAMAQKGTSMTPSTAWAINAVNNGAGSYCALARQFNQNTVLTVARNQSAETSFALDFQTPIFVNGATSTVVLDPGAGQQRAFKVRPVSDTAFVIKLGQDARFFDAVSRTGMLRVEIGSRSYYFNVADIDAGQSRLDACLVNMLMPAAGDEIDAVMPMPSVQAGLTQADIERAVADASHAHRQEINALRNKINALRQENQNLAQQTQAPAGAPVADDAITAKLEQQVKNLEEQNASLQQRLVEAAKPDVDVVRPVRDVDLDVLARLREENAKLKADLNAIKPDNATEIAALEAEVKSLLQQNEDLRKAAEVKTQDQVQVESLRTQITSLEQQNRDLNTQILQERAKVSEEYAQRVEALEIANAALSEKAGQGREDNQSAALLAKNVEHIASLEEQIDTLKAENAAKDKELVVVGQSMAELQSLQEANNRLKQELEAQQAQGAMTKDLLARITELENSNEALIAQAEAAKSMQNNAGVDLAVLEKENADLKARIEAQGSDDAEKAQQLAALEKANADLQAQVNAKGAEGSETAQALSALEQANAQNAQEVAALETENAALKAQISEQAAAQSREIASLNDQLAALKTEKNALSAQIADAGSVEGDLTKLQSDNQRLQNELADANAELKNLQDVQQELANLKSMTEQDSNAAQASLVALREEHDALKVAHDDLVKQRDELKKTLRDVVTLAEAYKETNTEQQARIEVLENDANALAETLKEKDDQIKVALQQSKDIAAEKDKEISEAKAEAVAAAKEMEAEQAKAAMQARQREAEEQSFEIAQADPDAPEAEPVVLDKNATFKEVMKAVPEVAQPAPKKVEKTVERKVEEPAPVKVANKVSAPAPARKPMVAASKEEVEVTDALVVAEDMPENQTPVRQYIAQQKAASQKVEESAQNVALAEEQLQDESNPAQKDALGYTLEEIEQEIAATAPDDSERLQQLEREYASLEALKAQEEARARNEGLIEDSKQAMASVEDAAQEYSAEAMNVMADMNEAQKHEYKAKLAAEALQTRKIEPQPVAVAAEDVAATDVEPEVVHFDEVIEKEPLDEVQLSAAADPFEGMDVQDLDEEASAVEGNSEVSGADAAPAMAAQAPAAASSIERIITSASVTSADKIKQVDKGERVAYQWNGGSVYGSAEQMPLSSPAQFDDLVKDYLQRTQSRCPGEFAVVPDSTSGGDNSRADSYEVACVSDAVSSGASLLFFNQGGTFTVVAHEAPAEELGTAMNYRNQVMRVVKGNAG